MIRAVMPRPRARLDLLEQFVYFAEHAGAQLGERYIAAVEKTCLQLAKRPYSGPRYDARVSRLDGLRRFPVSGFSQYVIFYIPCTSVIDVIRVLHGARDIDQLFSDEEGIFPEDHDPGWPLS